MDAKHTAEFTVRLHHLGPGGVARPALFFDCFQDAASEQSACLGVALRDLHKRGLTWVVSRYGVRFLRYPRWQERIQVTTWRSPQQGWRAVREFVITDSDGRTIGLARGLFVLLDRAANQAVSPAEHLPGYPVVDERVWNGDWPRIPAITAADGSTPVQVRGDDLDLNDHVNNSHYIDFALESVPRAISRSHTPECLDIIFNASAQLGDTVYSLIQRMDDRPPTFIHQLVGRTRDRVYAGLLTRWMSVS